MFSCMTHASLFCVAMCVIVVSYILSCVAISYPFPEDPCMEYLPTLTPKVILNNPNVGKYSSTMDP